MMDIPKKTLKELIEEEGLREDIQGDRQRNRRVFRAQEEAAIKRHMAKKKKGE